MGRVISPPPQVPKCGDLDRRFQAVDSVHTPKSGGSLEPEERRPPLGNFAMTLKIHLLLALIVWVGFAPYAWAEEKAATREGPTEELRAKAEKGDAESQFILGLIYFRGDGVPMNKAEAVKWFHKAAEQGDARAQFLLGVMYSNGRGIPKDETEAVKWWRKAAEQGETQAQHHLGLQYALGEGVPKDDVLAYKWSLLAGAKHEEFRKSISIIEQLLTPEQRAEGQKLAREFKPVIQK